MDEALTPQQAIPELEKLWKSVDSSGDCDRVTTTRME
jgi:hypothetical protein